MGGGLETRCILVRVSYGKECCVEVDVCVDLEWEEDYSLQECSLSEAYREAAAVCVYL